MAAAQPTVAVTMGGGPAQWRLRVRVDGEEVLATQYT
jgi:hypothetical protein